MRPSRFLTFALAGCAAVVLAGQVQQPPSGAQQQPPPSQQPTELAVSISGAPGLPPKLAVPDFIPLSNEAETVAAAKAIGQVLWDDLSFEREFYMIPRDTYRSIPAATSVESVPLDRWKELGADGIVIGTIRKGATGMIAEVRLLQVSTGRTALGKQYSGSFESVRDGGRIYAHTASDDIHQQQRGLRGVARTKLVFSSDRDGSRMKGPVGERDISNIYTSDYDGANQRRTTITASLDIAPVWAPDGNSIAYMSYRTGYPDIFVQSIRVLGTPQRPARGGTPEVQNYLPAWSLDGTKLAFATNRDGNMEIYVVNRDGSNLRRVTNHPSADVTPTWSPTGNQIAFVSDRTGSPQIYVVNDDGTDLRLITHEQHCDRPTWSPPPFNKIAYTSQRGGGNQINVYDLKTGETVTITDGIGSNESAAFSPNGRHLAFVSDRLGGKEQIFTIDYDGKNLRQITKTGRNRYPNWSQ
jgi:TolB protein